MTNGKIIKICIALTIIVLILLPLISIMVEERVWAQIYENDVFDRAFAVIQTRDGGFALAGSTESYTYGVEADFWLVKTDANGVAQWNQSYGGPGRELASTAIQTRDGGFALAGNTNDTSRYWWYKTLDFWLVKTDTNGTMLWNQTYGNSKTEECYSIIQTADGGFALTGYTESYGARGQDYWLVKTDANGVAQWNQTYGGTGEEVASTVIQTADGGFALAGITESYGAGEHDFWLVKTDANGRVQWNQTYGNTGDDWCTDTIQTADGGFVLVGSMQQLLPYGGGNTWLVKTDAHGITQWTQSFRSPYWDRIYVVVQTHDGGFALAGETTQGQGGSNFRLWKIDPRSSLSDTLEITTPALTATLLTVVIALLLVYWRKKKK